MGYLRATALALSRPGDRVVVERRIGLTGLPLP